MPTSSARLHAAATRLAALPSWLLYLPIFVVVACSHATLLHLPYFWDEGGYYIPAALDFYHTGQLVPHFTNAHPPLPSVLLGSLWHIVGYHIIATRLFVCAFAAAALLAIFRLTQRLLDPTAAVCVTLLTAVYPIWFAQSSLAHADIFAAAFTLSAFALYLPLWNAPLSDKDNLDPLFAVILERSEGPPYSAPAPESSRRLLAITTLLTLAVLSKETAIIQPATLAAVELVFVLRIRTSPARREHLRRLAALTFPLFPLLAWYAYHHHVTGFTFGNPEYLRYNATANLTPGHISQAIRYRFLHLFWQRNIWLPILLAIASLFLPKRNPDLPRPADLRLSPSSSSAAKDPRILQAAQVAPIRFTLTPTTLSIFALLILANWLFFSILGGALLTRYLLPIYPLILILCFQIWRTRTRLWPVFTAVTAAVFLSGLWINPPTSFAPEDTLTYRDMIVVHQQAIDYVAQHYPGATVLTAWPVAADLFRPELGYVTQPIHAHSIEDFTRAQIERAAADPGAYDTAIVFTTHYTTPSFRHWLLAHPTTARGREFAANRDLTPGEIALILGGQVIVNFERNGEWAAVIRFNRSYTATLRKDRPRIGGRTSKMPVLH